MGTHPIFESDFDCLTDGNVREMPNTSERNQHSFVRPWICGFGAALCDITFTFPINKIMFRQQLNGFTTRRAISGLRGEMSGFSLRGKVSHVYRGVVPPTFSRITGRMSTFGGYDNCLEMYRRKMSSHTSPLVLSAMAGMTAGVVEAFICCPLERVQTILQDDRSNRRFQNTYQLIRKLRLREYYRGIRPIVLRNGPSTFIYFTVYTHGGSYTDNEFLRGGVGGVAATCYAYIFNVVRARQQAILSPEEGNKYKSMVYTAKTIYNERDRSIPQVFRGFRVAILRSSLSWGITTWFYRNLYLYLEQHGR